MRCITLVLITSLIMAVASPADSALPQLNSPPGKIAFIRDGHLWLWEAGREHQVTTGPKDSSPRFSPSGRYIALVRERELWVTDEDRQWQVAATTGSFDWAPQADALAFSTESGVHTVSITPSGPQEASLVAAGWDSPAWSPDGQQLAVVRNTPGTKPFSGTTSIALLPHAGGEPQVVLQTPYPHESTCGPVDGASHLSWSADGRWLAFYRPGLWASLSADCGEIAVVESKGGQPTPVAVMPRNENWFRWAPTGATLSCVDGANRAAWTNKSLRLAKMPPRPPYLSLTPPGYADRDPAWSPDGRRLAFTRSQAQWPDRTNLPAPGQAIWVAKLPRGRTRAVPGSEQGFAPQWGPNNSLAWFQGVGGEQGSLWYLERPGQARQQVITGIDLPDPYYGEWHLDSVFDWWWPQRTSELAPRKSPCHATVEQEFQRFSREAEGRSSGRG